MTLSLEENISLSSYTSIGLGGKARFFYRAKSINNLIYALEYAKKKSMSVLVLGGGSNLLVPDVGFAGLVIKIELHGIQFLSYENKEQIRVGAGEDWDSFVYKSINLGFSGLECLSGIPGSVGASPIQNIGAYGQEVGNCIVSLECLDLENLELKILEKHECEFSYRSSLFKTKAKGKYIILSVNFSLYKNRTLPIIYEELKKNFDKKISLQKKNKKKEAVSSYLHTVREVVLELRHKKGMLLDAKDPHSRSLGSFFINPIIDRKDYENLKKELAPLGINGNIPFFSMDIGKKIKIPAAWLIEQAGFHKGYRYKGVGISKKHSLALVNYQGSTSELIELANKIRQKVKDMCGLSLQTEPTILD